MIRPTDCPSFGAFIRASSQPGTRILMGHAVLKINQVVSSANDNGKLRPGAKCRRRSPEGIFIGIALAS
jgi:hypothetical protein